MRQTWVRRLLPAVFVLALAAPVHGQSFGFAWWKDAQFQRELGAVRRPVRPDRRHLPGGASRSCGRRRRSWTSRKT